MANEQNLIPIKDSDVARAMQEKSAKKRSENVRERKLFKEEILKRMGEDDWNEMVDKLIARAKEQDKAFEVLRDTVGQKPTEKVENTNVEISYEDYINKVADDNEY